MFSLEIQQKIAEAPEETRQVIIYKCTIVMNNMYPFNMLYIRLSNYSSICCVHFQDIQSGHLVVTQLPEGASTSGKKSGRKKGRHS